MILSRIAGLVIWASLLLIYPAAAGRISSWLFAAGALAAACLWQNYVKKPWRHLLWLFPTAAAVLLFPVRYDTGAFLAIVLYGSAAAFRAWQDKNILSRCIGIILGCAMVLLFFKSFTQDWFSLYPAAAAALFSGAVWESSKIR